MGTTKTAKKSTKETQTEVQRYDLQKDYDRLTSIQEKKIKITSLRTYLKTGNYNLTYGDGIILSLDREDDLESIATFCLIKDNILYHLDDQLDSFRLEQVKSRIKDALKTYVVRGVFISNPQIKLILNGDNDRWDGDANEFVHELIDLKLPTTSFACLNRFYTDKSDEVAVQMLASGQLKIVEYNCDDTKSLSAEDRKVLRRKKNNIPKPPEAGYTLIHSGKGYNWHRSGTVLFQDDKKNMTILQGQDEGTYFGVELPTKCKTIKEGYNSLIPSEIRNKKVAYIRQGEWFMVSVAEKDVPKLKDCAAYSATDMCLPIENEDSNIHRIEAYDIRVSKNGLIYAKNPEVYHDEHQSISKEGWNTFYKNTALRAFSQEGVD